MASSFQPKAVSDGIIFCFDAANTKSYPGSGTIATDLSPTAITGSLTNGSVFSSVNGGIINFDGTDDSINFNNTLGNNLSSLTIESWVQLKRTSVTLLSDHIVSKGTSGNYQYALRLGVGGGISGSVSVVAWQTGGSNHLTAHSSASLNDGNWYHIVGVIIGNSLAKMYVDGGWCETRSDSTGSWNTSGTGNFLIGGRGDGVNYLSGSVSQVKIYNRALSATEILQNYNALSGRFGKPVKTSIVEEPLVDVIPNAVNWGDISSTSPSGPYDYTKQQITGISQQIMLKVDYGVDRLLYKVDTSEPQYDTSTNPENIGFDEASENETFNVNNGEWVSFSVAGRGQIGFSSEQVTIRNSSDGDTILDTFNITLTAGGGGG